MTHRDQVRARITVSERERASAQAYLYHLFPIQDDAAFDDLLAAIDVAEELHDDAHPQFRRQKLQRRCGNKA
jgi:hypothetical protein